ncbi:MAG: hypothetical protein VB095_11840 [Anaerovorax sp.]|nr:hypothetical protein [Anaerovorax sp.]
MEWNELVDEIAVRVKKKLDEQSSLECQASLKECKPKKRLLILSPDHSDSCHELWDCMNSNQEWSVECALAKNYDCDIETVNTVVLRKVSNERLVKIANGIGDTPLTALAIQAILMGKKVIIPTEELELLSYQKTAPIAYYDHMLQYVALLKRSGVQLCDKERLYSVICDQEECSKESCRNNEQPSNSNRDKEVLRVVKRVVTERDIHEAYAKQITEFQISEKTIVTDLAKDYARERGITFTVQ